MIQMQSLVEPTVIAFRPRGQVISSLDARDRLDLAHACERLRRCGYRAVVYEREAGDSPEVGSFLSLYRKGEPWARWSMARLGPRLSVWCGRTSQDVGAFRSLPEALQALLPDYIADLVEDDRVATGLLVTLSRVS
jgi:hypothetical protein